MKLAGHENSTPIALTSDCRCRTSRSLKNLMQFSSFYHTAWLAGQEEMRTFSYPDLTETVCLNAVLPNNVHDLICKIYFKFVWFFVRIVKCNYVSLNTFYLQRKVNKKCKFYYIFYTHTCLYRVAWFYYQRLCSRHVLWSEDNLSYLWYNRFSTYWKSLCRNNVQNYWK